MRRPRQEPDSTPLQRVESAQAKVVELKSLLGKMRSAADGQQASLSRLARARSGTLPAEEMDKAIRQMVASLMLFEGLGSTIAETFSQFEDPLTALMRDVTEKLSDREQLAALSRSAEALNSSIDLETVLDQTMAVLVELTGAERAFLMLRDNTTMAMTLRASHNIDTQQLSDSAFAISRSIIDMVIASREAVITTNAAADPRFSSKDSVALYALRSIICVPTLIGSKVTGVIYLDNRVESDIFSDADRDFASAFAAQVAVALENARLFQDVKVARNTMQDVFESLPSGIIAIDSRGRITLVNAAAARILGEPVLGMVQESYRRLARYLDGSLALLFDEVVHYSSTGAELVEGALPDGREVAVNASAAPLRNAEGNSMGAVMMLEDRTDSMHLERERAMVRRYLPAELVDTFSDSSALALSGARVAVSVMFADLRGFTAFSERRDPAEVVDLLNRCFGAASTAIRANAGILDKYMGDAVMAHFNSPLLPQAEHPLLAVRAAWDTRAAMRKAHAGDPGAELRFGIGISTGHALAGNIGAAEQLEYTLIGDTVNLAMRLQEIAAADQILISSTTYEAVREHVQVRPMEPLTLKGRSRNEPVYEILDLVD